MNTERSREEGRLPMGALCKSEMVSSPLSRCNPGPGYQAWQVECRLEFSPPNCMRTLKADQPSKQSRHIQKTGS